MSEVKRYCIDGYGSGMCVIEEGPYVEFEDFDAERLRADTAVAEVAALREELADLAELKAYVTIPLRERCAERKELQQRLTAAEQRNSDLVELLRAIKRHDPDTQCMTYPMHRRIDAALKPTESGASE